MSVVAPHETPPTVQEVERICHIPDAVIRNLEITHCYWRLATAVAARTSNCANWCAFATWASRQAGQTIRGEDMIASLRRRLHPRARARHPIRSFWRWLLRKGVFEPGTRLGRIVAGTHTPFDAFERASHAVARGNLKVFEEIGREFARYLAECPRRAEPASPAFVAFAAGFRPGDPPAGQDYLRRAFARYQQLGLESDPASGAPLAVLANLEIGFHEQTRLQPEICEAMDAGVTTAADLKRRLLAACAPYPWIRAIVVRRPFFDAAVGAVRALEQFSRGLAREIVTESLMVIQMPGDLVLPLGRHLPFEMPEPPDRAPHPELGAFLARFEAASASGDNCGADDWSNLDQRMHYIAHLFQAFHERPDLFHPPFDSSQVAQFQTGVVPDGGL